MLKKYSVNLAMSTGGLEFADSIHSPYSKRGVLGMTLQPHLIMRHLFRSSECMESAPYCHYCQIHSDLLTCWVPNYGSNHHHDVRLARISLTLSLHVSLSFIASGRSSGLHPVSSHSCCMNVQAGHPAFDWPYAGVHRSTSLTISSLLLQQCPDCLVRLPCIVFVIGGRWPYSWRRVGCCCQDLFNIARNILV